MFETTDPPAAQRATVSSGRIDVAAQHLEAGGGFLALPGLAPIPIRWDKSVGRVAHCSPVQLEVGPAQARIEGPLTPIEPQTEVTGCGGWTTTDGAGRFSMAAVPKRACTVLVRAGPEDRWQPLGRARTVAGETRTLTTQVRWTNPTGPLLGWTDEDPPQVQFLRSYRGAIGGDRLLALGDTVLAQTPMPLFDAASPPEGSRLGLP